MGNPVVVFDFDKTLTYIDTIHGFYTFCNKGKTLFFKNLLLKGWAVAYKLKLISNDTLKEKGVRLYLSGFTRTELEAFGKAYAQTITLNKVYATAFLQQYPQAIIASASFTEYLQPIFPHNTVIATEIEYDAKGFATGVRFNAYGKNKVTRLRALSVSAIDVLYTDSRSDQPMMDIAAKTCWVTGDEIKTL
jgi:phosphoserine phosphatase